MLLVGLAMSPHLRLCVFVTTSVTTPTHIPPVPRTTSAGAQIVVAVSIADVCSISWQNLDGVRLCGKTLFVLLLPLPLFASRQPDRVLMVMMIYAFSAVHVHEYPSKIVKLSFVYTKKVEIRNVLIETFFFVGCALFVGAFVCWSVACWSLANWFLYSQRSKTRDKLVNCAKWRACACVCVRVHVTNFITLMLGAVRLFGIPNNPNRTASQPALPVINHNFIKNKNSSEDSPPPNDVWLHSQTHI